MWLGYHQLSQCLLPTRIIPTAHLTQPGMVMGGAGPGVCPGTSVSKAAGTESMWEAEEGWARNMESETGLEDSSRSYSLLQGRWIEVLLKFAKSPQTFITSNVT